MRRYLRHPASIPLQFDIPSEQTPLPSVWLESAKTNQLKDVGGGGLCFQTCRRLDPGTHVHLKIPAGHPHFQADGVVAWCRYASGAFEVGVTFAEDATEYAMRMAEQICHIEQYRREVRIREGRWLTSDQAAAEWIDKYAEEFPA